MSETDEQPPEVTPQGIAEPDICQKCRCYPCQCNPLPMNPTNDETIERIAEKWDSECRGERMERLCLSIAHWLSGALRELAALHAQERESLEGDVARLKAHWDAAESELASLKSQLIEMSALKADMSNKLVEVMNKAGRDDRSS